MLPKNRCPVHPGEIIKEMYLKPLGITQGDFAKALGVSRPRINEILNCRRSVTPDTAIRLAKAFDTSPQYWLNLQIAFDLYDATQNNEYRNVRSLIAA